jgi:hypothetical protein
MWLSKFRTFVSSTQTCVGKKQKSHKIMEVKIFATLAEVKLNRENIRGLNMAADLITSE